MSQETTDQRARARVRMRGIAQDRYGSPEEVLRVAELDQPDFGEDEVLVRMRATSVNTPDWITITGVPHFIRLQAGLRKPATPVRGTDVAGVIVAVGSQVTDFEPGDEVFGSWWDGGLDTRGTFAEFSVGSPSQLTRKPGAISFEEAGAAGMSGLTALCAMRDVGRAGPGKKVLINGASGGVGTFAVQIAKYLGGHVTGVCSTRNVELVESLGADEVIDYTKQDFTRGDERYDVVLDNVMNHSPTSVATVLASDGVFMPNSVGAKGGFFAGLPRMARAALMGLGRTNVQFVGDWVPPTRTDLDVLAGLLESGAVRVVIDGTYPLEEAGKAVAHMLGHHARGNVVVTI